MFSIPQLIEQLIQLPIKSSLEKAQFHYAYEDIEEQDFRYIFMNGLDEAIKKKDKLEELEFVSKIGFLEYKQGEFDTAQFWFAHGFALSNQIKNNYFLSYFYSKIADIYAKRGNFKHALDYYYKILEFNDPENESLAYNGLAPLYERKEAFEKATRYIDKSYQINLKKKNYEELAFNLINSGNIRCSMEHPEEALSFYSNALKICYIFPFPYIEAMAVKRSANALHMLGFSLEGIKLLEYSNLICAKFGFKYLFVDNLKIIGTINFSTKSYTEALIAIDRGTKIAKANDYDLLLLYSLELKTKILKATEKIKEANALQEEVNDLHNLIKIKEQERNLASWLLEKERELVSLRRKSQAIVGLTDDLKQFRKIVSHDITEPLRNIKSFTNLLERRYKQKNQVNKENQEYFDFIYSGVDRMKLLLSDFFDYLNLGIDDQINPEDCDMKEVVDEALERLAPLIKARKAKITVFNKKVELFGRKKYFIELFYQLVKNGINFNDSKPPEIDIKVVPKKESYEFTITDNGQGIDEIYIEKLFLIFSQLERDNEDKTSGMGLAVSKKIVHMHAGSIWIDSEIDKGTKVHFLLPEN